MPVFGICRVVRVSKTMRTFIIWLVLAGGLVQGLLHAQSPLDLRLSVQFERLPLEEALYRLIDAGAPLSFSNSIIPEDYLVSLSANDMRLEQALRLLLSGSGLRFDVEGGLVVIREEESAEEFVVHGYVKDAETGEPLVGAYVYDALLKRLTVSNAYGFYSLRLPKGKRQISVSYLGYRPFVRHLYVRGNEELEIRLESSLLLTPVIVPATDLSRMLMREPPEGEHLDRPDLEALPTLGGERDLFRRIFLQPGVQTGADGFGGISVHGGGVDQNLVLLDGVPVYNPSHMVGLFSVFDDRVVRSARFWSHVFPARYGERASSVLDVRTREGNTQEKRLDAYVGLTSAGLLLEGPLQRDRSSFFLSFRRSLLDLYQPLYNTYSAANARQAGNKGRYYFYDFTAKANTRLGLRNRLFLSYYQGADFFKNESFFDSTSVDTSSSEYLRDLAVWGNRIAVLRFNREVSERLFVNLTATFSRFFFYAENQFSFERFVAGTIDQRIDFLGGYSSNNRDWSLKLDADLALSPRHYLRYGGAVIWHRFQPAVVFLDQVVSVDTTAVVINDLLSKTPQTSREVAFYMEDAFSLGGRWRGNVGLRHNILLLENYTYFSLQPRLSLSYNISDGRRNWEHVFYAEAGRFFQPLHLLSSSGIGLPRDIWVSSTRRIAPVDSRSWHLGWKGRWREQLYLGVGGYYKTMDNLLVFNQGASTDIDATNWQNHVLKGRGRSYGLEASAFWRGDSWTLRAVYSLSQTQRQFDDINGGRPYPYRYDRRHNFNIQAIYKKSKHWTWSAQWIWRSGMAVTLPHQFYEFNQLNLLYSNFPPQFPFVVEVPFGESQNSFRMPAYHRMDVGGTYELASGRKLREVSFGVYNLYVRKNPLYYFIRKKSVGGSGFETRYYRFVLLPVMPYVKMRWIF